jgi:hypothetical protein
MRRGLSTECWHSACSSGQSQQAQQRVMDTIKDLVKQIQTRSDCLVYPCAGPPSIADDIRLPHDLAEFFSLCGGAELFQGQLWPVTINPPHQFRHANTAIVRDEAEYDRSYSWYLVASSFDEQISIDLSSERSGWCYDSFWDCHAMAGSCRVLAKSFNEFLARCIEKEGRVRYWSCPGFTAYVDAYDD